jgi:hypothetical protein
MSATHRKPGDMKYQEMRALYRRESKKNSPVRYLTPQEVAEWFAEIERIDKKRRGR